MAWKSSSGCVRPYCGKASFTQNARRWFARSAAFAVQLLSETLRMKQR
jgi:hypothetical protein